MKATFSPRPVFPVKAWAHLGVTGKEISESFCCVKPKTRCWGDLVSSLDLGKGTMLQYNMKRFVRTMG